MRDAGDIEHREAPDERAHGVDSARARRMRAGGATHGSRPPEWVVLLLAVTLAVMITTILPNWVWVLLPGGVDPQELWRIPALAIFGGPAILLGAVVGLLSATLAIAALRSAERTERRSPWAAVLVAGSAASAGPVLGAVATIAYFSGMSADGLGYRLFYALLLVVEPYPLQLLAAGVGAAIVVGSYRWSDRGATASAPDVPDVPDALKAHSGRRGVPVLAGLALALATVSLANPIAMGFVYGGLSAQWEPASPDLIDRIVVQTSLVALIPLAAVVLGSIAIFKLGRVRTPPAPQRLVRGRILAAIAIVVAVCVLATTILVGAGRVLRVHNAIILSEQVTATQPWQPSQGDGGGEVEARQPRIPSPSVTPDAARLAMEQLLAQLVGAIGAGAPGGELRWLDASDAGDSTGNDSYALAEAPGAVVEESCMEGAGIRYSMPPATFALGLITDTSSDESDAEVIDANVAAADRIVALLEGRGYVEDGGLGGNIYLLGQSDAAAATVAIHFGFGTATVAADGLCVIDAR